MGLKVDAQILKQLDYVYTLVYHRQDPSFCTQRIEPMMPAEGKNCKVPIWDMYIVRQASSKLELSEPESLNLVSTA